VSDTGPGCRDRPLCSSFVPLWMIRDGSVTLVGHRNAAEVDQAFEGSA
jgi:hypothetical protein